LLGVRRTIAASPDVIKSRIITKNGC